MNGILKGALLQMEQKQKAFADNIASVERYFEHLPEGTDLVVLPEMWTTGFMTSKEELDEGIISESFLMGKEAMARLSREHSVAVYGSLIEPLKDGKLSNSAYFYGRDGEITGYYSKHQLFGPGGERTYFEAGSERVQISFGGFRIRLAVCYDLRFPVWLRQDESLGLYDLLLVCANWPLPRDSHWQTLLKARAIENQAFVLATNRIGDGPKGLVYPGLSTALDGWGNELATGEKREAGWLTAELRLADIQKTRSSFPVLDTLDSFDLT